MTLPCWRNMCWACGVEFLQERSCRGRRAIVCGAKDCRNKRRRFLYRGAIPLELPIEVMRWCAGGYA